MASSFFLTAIVCLVLLLPSHSLNHPTKKSFSSRSRNRAQPVILPLNKQIIPRHALPKPPNKLLFHHNVSLTVPLTVGTPQQNVTLVLDTGSELTWLLCNSTSTSPHFRQKSSTSYSPLPCSSPICSPSTTVPSTCDASSRRCHVSLSYADASSSDGSLSVDAFLIGHSPPSRTIFGCMDSSYSSAADDAPTSGILGMNRGALSFITQSHVSKFSYCISDRDSSGLLLIGDSSNLNFPVPFNYTPLVQISLPLPYFDRVAYSVQLEGIRVGNAVLPLPKSVLVPDHTGAGQTMVDSGTQFTFLLGPVYDVLKSEFLRQTGRVLRVLNEPEFVFQEAFDTCFLVRQGDVLPGNLPEVSLVFRGAEVGVRTERLLYRVAGERRGKDGIWCLTFGNSDMVPMEAYVIGHHHQQNVWVEYDLENGRVGFAPMQCDQASQRLGLAL